MEKSGILWLEVALVEQWGLTQMTWTYVIILPAGGKLQHWFQYQQSMGSGPRGQNSEGLWSPWPIVVPPECTGGAELRLKERMAP